jgi:hypothetical protein
MQWFDAAVDVVIPLAIVNVIFTPVIYMPVSWFSADQRQGIMGRGRITSPL